MKRFALMCITLMCITTVHAADIGPVPLPESYRPYVALMKELYSTEGLTFGEAIEMVRPMADELDVLIRDKNAQHLLFLEGQKHLFEEEEARLQILGQADPDNTILKDARYLMHRICKSIYPSVYYWKRDLTNLYAGRMISIFFSGLPTPFTDMFPLHIHKLLFLMYFSHFLRSISLIVTHPQFVKEDDSAKPFLEVFDDYLKRTLTQCGNMFYQHAQWILKDDVVFVADNSEDGVV